MVASSQTVQDFPKMFKGFSQQKGTRIEKLRHTVLHEERVNGTFLAIVSALLLKHFSHFLLKTQIVQDHSIYAFGWIQILRRWNIVSKVSNNSGGVRWFMIWKLRSNSFVFVHVRIIWNLWMSLEWLSIFDQLRGQMATLKIAYGPSVMLRQGGHGCQQPTVTQSALPRCGWWWRLRP